MVEHRYHWFITTLTPLHIGSGERLREGFDFVVYDGALWIANQGALFRAMLEEALKVRTADEAQVAAEIAGMTLYQFMDNKWLRPEHFDLSRGIFAYRLPGSTKGQQGELFVHIKDIENRPYLPGSSLKGALRSAVLRAAAAKETRKPEYQRGNPKTAASRMEHRHFAVPNSDWSKFPYFDLWRALRIADSAPRPTETLTLAQAVVYRRPAASQSGAKEEAETIPLDLEVIPAGVTLEASSWVETWLFDDRRAARELAFHEQQKQWLTSRLRGIVNEESRLRLVEETKLFMELVAHDEVLKSTQRALDKVADEYAALSANEMLLPVGKGTGWRGKTLGRVLQDKLTDEEFERLVRDFNLGRKKWKRGEQIPYTRLLVSAGEQRLAPMGWVKIRLEPGKRA